VVDPESETPRRRTPRRDVMPRIAEEICEERILLVFVKIRLASSLCRESLLTNDRRGVLLESSSRTWTECGYFDVCSYSRYGYFALESAGRCPPGTHTLTRMVGRGAFVPSGRTCRRLNVTVFFVPPRVSRLPPKNVVKPQRESGRERWGGGLYKRQDEERIFNGSLSER